MRIVKGARDFARSSKTGVLLALIPAALLARLFSPSVAAAPIFDQGPVLNLIEENDFVNGTDRWYTQGARISFLQADNDLPRWSKSFLDLVPALGFSPGANRIGYECGQSMFTPANTRAYDYQPNDRPYAGWLYAGLMLQRRGVGVGDLLTLENFELQLGIIGPDSRAGQLQTWYHHEAPHGWSHQIQDEPGIAVRYGRAWLIPLPDLERHYFDILPQGGLSAGNVDTSFRAGAILRAGWNIPDDFSVQPIDSLFASEGGWSRSGSKHDWGFYAFTGVEGRAQIYTAFLDGNAFRESHSIDKETFFGEWRSGIALVLKRVELAYTHLFRTREFKDQPEGQVYGSFTLRYKF